ncbi:hypothetical protein A3747_20675 [Sulfitobacter sp. HI0076]|nr:hypothetical protein A3720_01290 [Sulfitobacter sp. HI0021]KZY03073.1 hypothetical protein A3722_04125 [Sulfitobacter sp. HI0027]KZY98422.1 hypothetical protein A3747_23160 [Sulfitobacter sp. HI0076]KZZ00945.1 hypothetical protein A3747_20675 [Sulfitobacter sp. HI0076]
MTRAHTTGRSLLAVFLCTALSLMPAFSHAPLIFETIQDHAEMIAEHGHSHGLEEDLAWAMHGHGHDTADHDHSQAILIAGRISQPFQGYWDLKRPDTSDAGPWPVQRIERPPRI